MLACEEQIVGEERQLGPVETTQGGGGGTGAVTLCGPPPCDGLLSDPCVRSAGL